MPRSVLWSTIEHSFSINLVFYFTRFNSQNRHIIIQQRATKPNQTRLLQSGAYETIYREREHFMAHTHTNTHELL